MLKKYLILLFASITLYSLTSHFAFAQNTPFNLTVFPATIDLSANPGTTVTQRIRLRNNSTSPINLNIQTSKLTTNINGDVIPVDSKDDYLSWISYNPSSITANPNEWIDINMQIKIPETAAFGYYYAIRISPANSSSQNKTNGSTLIGQTLVPILLDVRKSGAEAQIQLISFSSQSVFEYLPATFQITLINKGNIHIRPVGNVFIQSGNSDIDVLDVNTTGAAILPSQKRTFTTSWDDGFITQDPIIQDDEIQKDTNGNPKTQLIIHWNKLTSFRIGKYTAHLLAVYDNGTKDVPIEADVTFWVFPWKFILGVIFGTIVAILLIRMWLKWYVAKEIKKHRTS